MLEPVLGSAYLLLPDLWTWWIEPNEGAAGWAPHRDRLFDTLRADRSPRSLSTWIALTDATRDNGCIYVIPAQLDDDYVARRFGRLDVSARDARALPAPAGTVLAWSQGVVHWGGHSTERAAGPRVSIALEFQERETTPFDSPIVEPAHAPDLERRLAIAGKNLFAYWDRAGLPLRYLDLALYLGQSLSSPSSHC